MDNMDKDITLYQHITLSDRYNYPRNTLTVTTLSKRYHNIFKELIFSNILSKRYNL